MTTRYVDLENGNDSNNGSSFALRKKTIGSAISGLVGGDTIRVMASLDPTDTNQNATFTNGSDTVTLDAAVTINIDNCESAWTASANVTATAQSTTQREGTNAASLAIASAFTTGLIAYKSFSSTSFAGIPSGPFSADACTQISLLVRANAAVAASVLQLKLCSDTVGAVAVNTINIPAITSGYWQAVTVDTGAALGDSIQSVALYAVSDPGTVTVYLDNIIACKDPTLPDSLTHQSLISKNNGTDPWLAIDSINGTTIKLAGGYQDTASRSGLQPYYYGTTETVELYKREPIILTTYQNVSTGGLTQSNTINIECGWDRTAMSSQNGQTFCRLKDPASISGNGLLYGMFTSYVYVNRWYSINVSNGGFGFLFNRGWGFGEVGAIACTYGFGAFQAADVHVFSSGYTRYSIHCSQAWRFAGSVGGSTINGTRIRMAQAWGYLNSFTSNIAFNDIGGSSVGLYRLTVVDCDIQGHYSVTGSTNSGVGTFFEAFFHNCTIKNLNRNSSSGPQKIIQSNCTVASLTNPSTLDAGSVVYRMNQAGDTANHDLLMGQYVGQGTIVSDISTRHTASDFSWKLTSNTANTNALYPSLSLSIAKVACVANEQRTVKAWLRRDSTSLTARLRVKGGLVLGIADDIVSNMSAAINTWEQVTIQFTPTQKCVVEVFAECFGASQIAWVDDVTVS